MRAGAVADARVAFEEPVAGAFVDAVPGAGEVFFARAPQAPEGGAAAARFGEGGFVQVRVAVVAVAGAAEVAPRERVEVRLVGARARLGVERATGVVLVLQVPRALVVARDAVPEVLEGALVVLPHEPHVFVVGRFDGRGGVPVLAVGGGVAVGFGPGERGEQVADVGG